MDEWIEIIRNDDNNLKNYIHYQNLEELGMESPVGCRENKETIESIVMKLKRKEFYDFNKNIRI